MYRLDVGAGTTTQVTDLVTGVSGITALSPSLSVGRGRLVFSVYEDDKHRIYAIEDAARLAGRAHRRDRRPAARGQPAAADAQLGRDARPPRATPRSACRAPRRSDKTEYKPKLSLDYIGQPTLSVGADRTGAFVGGGVSFLFSDVLGHHTLSTVLQVNGQFEDFGGDRRLREPQAPLELGRRRWNTSPTSPAGFASGFDGNVFIEEAELFRQINRSLTGYVGYPFSRAHRVELSAAARNIGFSAERQTRFFDGFTGDFLGEEEEDLPAPDGLTFGEASAALVYDTAVFGATSPILGRRYRLEASSAFGSINYTGVLADVRQYVMPKRPFTFAFRALHYGRYGAGGEDARLSPLFIGYPNLVRGYDTGSFDASECGPNPNATCPVFDQLAGQQDPGRQRRAALPALRRPHRQPAEPVRAAARSSWSSSPTPAWPGRRTSSRRSWTAAATS